MTQPFDMETIFAYLNNRTAYPYNRLQRVKSEPIPDVEVTKDVYWHFLEILPPGRAPGVDFFVIERITGDTVSAFKRVGDRYFHRYIEVDPRA